ncbi:MAG: hypothetical protein JWL80_542 [Parcubacteria group bacterium]|nr:hypothetical protein [Parcubacteria group bacterium]
MTIASQTLKEIAESVLQKLQVLSKEEMESIVNMADYHGFLKSRLPQEFLDSVLIPFNLTSHDVQIEVVEVATDLTHEVHYHEHSFAYCVCMGEKYHVAPPTNALAYLIDHWAPVTDGEVVEIPPGTPHGFTIKEGGTLTFLSVQAPPIVHADHDDYHRINS